MEGDYMPRDFTQTGSVILTRTFQTKEAMRRLSDFIWVWRKLRFNPRNSGYADLMLNPLLFSSHH
jgi:hypothetical protein